MSNLVLVDPRALRGAMVCASGDESRSELCSVVIRPTGACVGTDGHRLWVSSPVTESVEDFPVVPDGDVFPESGIMVSRDLCVEILKLKPAKWGVGRFYAFSFTRGEVRSSVTVHCLGKKGLSSLGNLDATSADEYPRIDRVWPKGDARVRISWDASYLRDIAAALESFGGKHGRMTLSVGRSDGAFTLEAGDNGDRVAVVLMPLRLPDGHESNPFGVMPGDVPEAEVLPAGSLAAFPVAVTV